MSVRVRKFVHIAAESFKGHDIRWRINRTHDVAHTLSLRRCYVGHLNCTNSTSLCQDAGYVHLMACVREAYLHEERLRSALFGYAMMQ